MRRPLAPLDHEPVSVHAPFVSFPDDRYRYENTAQRRAALVRALEGVELGAYDEYILEWLAGWDVGIVAAVVSLLLRLRTAATHQTPHRGGGEPR